MPELKSVMPEEQTRRLIRQTLDTIRASFARLLRVKDEDKPQIYSQVFRNAEVSDLNYWLEVTFSIGIATLGLIISSPAVVIGAMLISPLMGPIFAVGMAIALGDFYLGFRSFLSVILSVLGSVALAAVVTWLLPFHNPTPEILARVQPTLLDLAIAILSGLAGAIVVCRGGTGGGVTALPGVAVAVALMPPLAVVGFGVGIGWDWSIMRGGGLLFLTNLVAIILSSVLVFFSIRMDAIPVRHAISTWLREQEHQDRLFRTLQRTPLRHLLGTVGTLPRRLLILMVFLVPVCVPLFRTLNRLVTETNARRIVQAELESVIPKDALFRQEITFGPDRIHISAMAVLPQGFTETKRKQVEEDIERRTGLQTELSIFEVPTRSELTSLIDRTASVGPASIEGLDELNAKIWLRLKPALLAVWPGQSAPLVTYSLRLKPGSGGLELDVVYLSDQDLGDLGRKSLQQVLQDRSGAKNLKVIPERIPEQWVLSFRPYSARLTPSDEQTLKAFAGIPAKYPSLRCTILPSNQKKEAPDKVTNQRVALIQKFLEKEGGGTSCLPDRSATQASPAVTLVLSQDGTKENSRQ
jgi:uncharacterized hydrophobic protein (TIGR00271 family)